MKMNFDLVIEFFKKHYKLIGIGLGVIFILYWVIFILTPSVKMSASAVQEMKKIDEDIQSIKEEQVLIYTEIKEYEQDILRMDENINEINNTKNQIAGEYGEKINAARSYDYKQLVTFLSERYSDSRIH